MLRVVAKLAAIACFALILQQTEDPFPWLGTDGAIVVRPPFVIQTLCVMIFTVALFFPAHKARLSRLAVLLAMVTFGAHRLIIDQPRGKMADTYLGIQIQSIALPPSDDTTLSVQTSIIGFIVQAAPSSAEVWCFSPILIGLDRHEIAKLSTL